MPRVLLVEDDPSMLSLLTTLLTFEGFEALHLEDDSEDGIVQAVCQTKPDLVFMDVHLRRANGLEVLRRIRTSDTCPQVRIMMSSGMDFNLECRQAGADSFILKPYMPDELVSVMRSVLALDAEDLNH